ncbi:MAG: NADH-quinone oxidoreductase subunit J [Acidobacteria bacterium]|nr:NADH-quinone oxidoreductase subunit J [Acidobacteriota bacterium]
MTPLLAATTFDVPGNVVFAVLAVFMVVAAIRVVTTRNIVHAALWLVVVLGGNAIVYLILQAEFVAMTQLLVYIGAIIVLFLFGIMLTRAPLGTSDDLDNNQRWLGAIVGVLLLLVIGFAVTRTWGDDRLDFAAYDLPVADETAGAVVELGGSGNGRTQALANSIFSDYLIPFEVVSVLLTGALIGAIVLARRD